MGIVAIDDVANARDYLEKIEISDKSVANIDITLNAAYKRGEITCTDGKSKAELFVDPTSQYDF